MSTTPGRPPRGSGRPPGARPPAPSPPPVPAPASGGAPRPPRELDRDPAERRSFGADDGEWIAWVSGKGAWGSGAYGLGMVVAVHFARAEAPAEALREALLPRGRFAGLYDEELCALLASATPIVRDAPPRREPPRRDRRGRDW